MPWKKNFNENIALEKVMYVFWSKGYEASSISDLTKATGINKSSLYNSFGDKEALFRQSIKRYEQDRKLLLSEFEALNSPIEAIVRFFDFVVETSTKDADKKGCFLFNTAQEIGIHSPEVASVVNNGVREIEYFFQRSIEVGQTRRKISTELKADLTAKLMLAAVVAIRSLGRGVYRHDELEVIARQAIDLIGPMP